MHLSLYKKWSFEDFFSKCDQIRRKLRISSHLLEKSLTENFILVHQKWTTYEISELVNLILF